MRRDDSGRKTDLIGEHEIQYWVSLCITAFFISTAKKAPFTADAWVRMAVNGRCYFQMSF